MCTVPFRRLYRRYLLKFVCNLLQKLNTVKKNAVGIHPDT
jgi:hypothetical protein